MKDALFDHLLMLRSSRSLDVYGKALRLSESS